MLSWSRAADARSRRRRAAPRRAARATTRPSRRTTPPRPSGAFRCAALLLFRFAPFWTRRACSSPRIASAAAPRRSSVTAAPARSATALAPARYRRCRLTQSTLKLSRRRCCASRRAPCWRPQPARRARCVHGRATRRCRFASWRYFARPRGAPPCCAAQPRSSSTWRQPSPGRACPDALPRQHKARKAAATSAQRKRARNAAATNPLNS